MAWVYSRRIREASPTYHAALKKNMVWMTAWSPLTNPVNRNIRSAITAATITVSVI